MPRHPQVDAEQVSSFAFRKGARSASEAMPAIFTGASVSPEFLSVDCVNLNMPQSIPRLNATDWETAIGREREKRTFTVDPSALSVLRQRFSEISTRTRQHRQSAWISRPGFAALRNVSDSALELTRLGFQELSLFDTPGAPTIPLPALSQLLTENQTRLLEIDQRLARLQLLVMIAEQLREPLELLISSGSTSFGLWQPLLLDLVEYERCQTSDSIDARSSADFTDFLKLESWPRVWFYVPAIHRATWMVKLQRLLPELQPYPIDVLLLPALLADCGQWIQFPDHGRKASAAPLLSATDYQRHPEISAALLGLIDRISPLSCLLASQHHERLDGTGYPRHLKLSQLNAVSRCFSVVTRWSELMLSSTDETSGSDSRFEAARTLAREARLGAFDLPMVNRLLAAVGAEVSAGLSVVNQRKLSEPLPSFHTPLPRVQVSSSEDPNLVRFIDGPETISPPAMLSSPVSALKASGLSAQPTPRPAVSGYR